MRIWLYRLAFPLSVLLVLTFWVSTASAKVTPESAVSIEACYQPGPQYEPGDELTHLRTRTSKTYWLGGAQYAVDSSVGAIHYAAGGNWQEFDNSLAYLPAQGLYDMDGAGYSVSVLEDFTAGQVLTFSKAGYSVAFQPMALEWTNDLDQIQTIAMPASISPSVVNMPSSLPGYSNAEGVIRWNDGYGPGIDFEWRTTPTRLQKRLEVASNTTLPVPEQYILDGGNPVLRLNLIFAPSAGIDIYVDDTLWSTKGKVEKRQTFSTIEFRSGATALWGFLPLYYWDSTDASGQSVATLEKRGQSLYISIRVPLDWLEAATYPVYIDTDVDEQVDASARDAYASDNTGTGWTTTANSGSLGRNWGNTYVSGLKFTGVNITDGATINSNSTIQFRADGSRSGTIANAKISAEENVSPSDFSTWADFDGRTMTSTNVTWTNLMAWTDETWYGSGGGSDFYNVTAIVQEVVDDTAGQVNDIVFRTDSGAGNSNEAWRVYFHYDHWDSGSTKTAVLHIEYTAGGGCSPDISNTPSTHSFGVVSENTTYWASGTTPTFPLDSANCTFNVTNSSGGPVNITIKATNWTGGINWTLSNAPGADRVMLQAGREGDNHADLLTLTEAEQAFITSLANNASKEWELKLETPTSFSDGVVKESTVTLTATCE